MSARHRRRKRANVDFKRQADMLERYYRPAARILFTRYMRQLLEHRVRTEA